MEEKILTDTIPKLNGLVLAGGKSSRMGTAKELLAWHNKEQRYYIADMLKKNCDEVFISCRAEQEINIDKAYKTLPDSFLDIGPLNGILSAFRSHPGKAWLVIACDLPLVNEETLSFLIANRNPAKIATAYKNPSDALPEPLITIWEPESYPVLLNSLNNKITSPRAVLIHNDITLLQPHNPEALLNVNTPGEAFEIQEILNKKRKQQ